MLTREENETLTRVGPGTPAGELLRRYWLPVGVASELTRRTQHRWCVFSARPWYCFAIRAATSVCSNERCPHRGASLSYGRVEARGIACAYHGWLFNTKGNCLETPAEPCESKFHLTVKQRSYPVQKLVGLYWAYLGPLPAPLIANFDIWFRKDGRRKIFIQPQLDCQLVSAHGKFHGSGAFADSSPGNRRARPAKSKTALAGSPTTWRNSIFMKFLTA